MHIHGFLGSNLDYEGRTKCMQEGWTVAPPQILRGSCQEDLLATCWCSGPISNQPQES